MPRGGKIVDMVGQRFGRLVVLEFAGIGFHRQANWRAKCDCGNVAEYRGYALRSGKTQSCGCKQRDVLLKRNLKHGASVRSERTPEYETWYNMKRRCSYEGNSQYKDYGGRGIKVCAEWENDFAQFLSDMGSKPSKEMTIERLDNNLGYSPSNCVWATRSTNCRNKRNNRSVVRGDGVVYQTIAEAAEAVGGSVPNIIGACKGILKTSAGFTWKYRE
jgi:hypothetical protein